MDSFQTSYFMKHMQTSSYFCTESFKRHGSSSVVDTKARTSASHSINKVSTIAAVQVSN